MSVGRRISDFWDSVNLQSGGGYLPKPKLAAFSDLLAQLAPRHQDEAPRSRRLADRVASGLELLERVQERQDVREGLPAPRGGHGNHRAPLEQG